MLESPPFSFEIDRTRWRLQDVGRVILWLMGYSVPGIRYVLRRLGFRRKQARDFVRSTDPEYARKWRAALEAFAKMLDDPEHVVFLCLDELTYYRSPTRAPLYHRRGRSQPLARQAPRPNTRTRLLGVLNAHTGRVHYLQRSRVGQKALQDFYAQLRQAYPQAHTIYILQDNWPVHKLPAVLQALETHHLQPLFLPAYAAWLNPIEKLWRWLKQDVLHVHPWADDLETLRQHVSAFMDRFSAPSEALLHYVGLL